jgi:hypothetical protein
MKPMKVGRACVKRSRWPKIDKDCNILLLPYRQRQELMMMMMMTTIMMMMMTSALPQQNHSA